ncbi:hypothetical protein RISK_003910 [Rhodopirellula islandica]|uniref:Uncharacterized protein n=1 Tax=Rhodopirellula islandica TaxID=595434 RepID=A0A0J1BBP8_RHOIS|nr:hypothetical protein RISK_003910 [Rhodopirellula islandica]
MSRLGIRPGRTWEQWRSPSYFKWQNDSCLPDQDLGRVKPLLTGMADRLSTSSSCSLPGMQGVPREPCFPVHCRDSIRQGFLRSVKLLAGRATG